jgi:DNA-binding beta-propeller fold protein YncE
VAFNLDSRVEVGRAELAGVPDVAFVNGAVSRIYVAFGDPGVIQVFDTNSLALLETVPTEPGAHTIGYDSKRGKVYAFLPTSCQAAVFVEAR